MREVGAPQHAVGQHVAEGQERVERSGVEPVQKLLQKIVHASSRRRTPARAKPDCSRESNLSNVICRLVWRMAVSWTKHRFAGGALVLDTANTVVLRGDPSRTFDRFEDPAEIARFACGGVGFSLRRTRRTGAHSGRSRSDRAAGPGSPGNGRPAVSLRRLGRRHRNGASAGAAARLRGLSRRQFYRHRRVRKAVRRSVRAARVRSGAGRLGAVAAFGRRRRRSSRPVRTADGCFWTEAAIRAACGAT